MTNFGVSLKTLLYANGNTSRRLGGRSRPVPRPAWSVTYSTTAVTFTSSTTTATSSYGPLRGDACKATTIHG